VAHEIRNPLTVMKMLYHSLNLEFAAGDPRAKDARIIGEKIEHLNKIVERILAFARTSEPNLAPVNLNQLIDELGLLVRHKLKNQGIEWIIRLHADLPPVSGDATQLEQAFLNLILNATEAMPKGGTLTITSRPLQLLQTSGQPTHVLVEFKDTGEGMNQEQRQRAFTSLLNTTKRTGTGLGLAIVQRIVEAHHGKLSIRSQPAKGTTIRVVLPNKPPAAE
jgi:signal transduction histidine kinase